MPERPRKRVGLECVKDVPICNYLTNPRSDTKIIWEKGGIAKW